MTCRSHQHLLSHSQLLRGFLMRAHQNDPDAWERLFHLYGPLVYGWARQADLQPQDASDMVQ